MLKHTFCCFTGVSKEAEQKLWSRGCLTWDDYLLSQPVFSMRKHIQVCEEIKAARIALKEKMADFFLLRLKDEMKPRITGDFHSSIGYIDIETTGLSASDFITTIALYGAGKLWIFVNGVNINDFLITFRKFSLLVSFNGSLFDVPRIKKHFKIDLLVPHLDLKPVLGAYGFRGAMKIIERKMGVERESQKGIDGSDAVKLWEQFSKNGDKTALNTLIQYNCEDVLVLERLLTTLYNRSMVSSPLYEHLGIARQPIVKRTVDQFFKNFDL